ncbi:sulfite exporter TauE/SafE family protein [Brevibacillus fluminis]|uniref:Probable membrane transporter protein n=1 Tax=Brevibacillus fluminis TaxID=511487 RepID=A0A3M8D3B6_9BACL|nr:sulfite exporter TauE/SafE family protein [Brevibacillus fluminis]RNB82403.1 sulfite exporter TauE/SafE family protein [Brevibacillus fluminis]
MDLYVAVVMVSVGLVGSFFSGLLGIGGAIIAYPLLLFVPSALGIAHYSGQEVSTISMFQVFFASLAGIFTYQWKNKKGVQLINKGVVTNMGTSILIGSAAGGVLSAYLSGEVITYVYGGLAVLAVILMLRKEAEGESEEQSFSYNRPLAATLSFGVGIVSGIVGAGGAFILIPIMLSILKIPTRVAIASSLAIVFLSSIGGVAGKLAFGSVPLTATIFTVVGSLIGAPLGSLVSAKVTTSFLRYGLLVLLTGTAIKIWMGMF